MSTTNKTDILANHHVWFDFQSAFSVENTSLPDRTRASYINDSTIAVDIVPFLYVCLIAEPDTRATAFCTTVEYRSSFNNDGVAEDNSGWISELNIPTNAASPANASQQ
ncbi:hypothetical protein [Mycolicibacterium agri]|uniref:hypothetical protein n=1 Tax=Mycolicibacterium agri TaxID=36811 RepID=UPI0013D7B05D|nr:hypothetical protein [Mycolicibacterium agri]